jgi:hypothetical protein
MGEQPAVKEEYEDNGQGTQMVKAGELAGMRPGGKERHGIAADDGKNFEASHPPWRIFPGLVTEVKNNPVAVRIFQPGLAP